MFNQLHSIANQELFEKHLCNHSSHYENMDDFHYERKPSHATSKLTPFAGSQDEWDTKEDTGKSMKNTMYILRYAKRISRANALSNSKKITPVVLTIIELCLSEDISQSVSQSVSQWNVLFNGFFLIIETC